VFADATAALAKNWCAFWTLPGSTWTSHAKGASLRPANCQIPECHMASLPALNSAVSSSGPNALSGMTLPTLSIR
jgi:hypothetical protein